MMVASKRWMTVGLATLGLVVGPFAAPAVADGQANGHNIETVDCEGLGTIDISTQNTHSDQGWGAVQIVGSTGHLIPVAFTFMFEDLTTDTVLFSDSATKGSGQAASGETVTCTESFSGTWAEVGEPGEPIPEGVAPDDILQFTLTAQVIVKP